MYSKNHKSSDDEQIEIDYEINRFFKCKIIEMVTVTDNSEYISNIFFQPKKEGKLTIILNLKSFNENFLEKIHFKMEFLQSAIDAMRKTAILDRLIYPEHFIRSPA